MSWVTETMDDLEMSDREALAMEPKPLSAAPWVRLNNGLRVVNFCSGHEFRFADTTVLLACKNDRVDRLACTPVRVETMSRLGCDNLSLDKRAWINDVEFTFDALPHEVINELDRLNASSLTDVVIVPLMLLQALKALGRPLGKARTIIRAGREKQGQPAAICCDRFGI